jgi:hypothetical protein
LSRCICALAVVVSAAKVAQWELYRFGDRGGQMVAIDRLQEPASQTGRQSWSIVNNFTPCVPPSAACARQWRQALRLGTTMVLRKGACLSNQTCYFRTR